MKSKNEMIKRDILGELKREAEAVLKRLEEMGVVIRRYEEQLDLRDAVISELGSAVMSLSRRVESLEGARQPISAEKFNARILDLI